MALGSVVSIYERIDAPRVYWLRHPIAERSRFYLFGLAAGSVLAWVASYLLVVVGLSQCQRTGRELPSIIYYWGILSGFLGMIYFIWRQGTKPYRAARRKNPLRIRR